MQKLGVDFSKVPQFDYSRIAYKDYRTLIALQKAGLELSKFVTPQETDIGYILGINVSRYLDRTYLWQGDKEKAKLDFFNTIHLFLNLGIVVVSDTSQLNIENFAVKGNFCDSYRNEESYKHFAPFDLKTDHGCPDYFKSCQPCEVPYKYLASDIQNEIAELFSSYGEIKFEQATITTLGVNSSNSITDQLAF